MDQLLGFTTHQLLKIPRETPVKGVDEVSNGKYKLASKEHENYSPNNAQVLSVYCIFKKASYFYFYDIIYIMRAYFKSKSKSFLD